jgi:DNA-binding response OmpR family regulator
MKPHILLVDDDKDELTFFLDALKAVPSDDGFKCTYAAGPKQADEMLRWLEPDYIFLDFHMPGMNGLQFLVNLKERVRSNRPRIYLYSIHINDKIRRVGLGLGASGIIKKKYTIRELTEELTALFTVPAVPAYVFSGGHHVAPFDHFSTGK